MEKPKIIIVGISNDRSACQKAIEYTKSIGFECLVIDPMIVVNTPKQTIETLK